jgi:hypothetical protein
MSIIYSTLGVELSDETILHVQGCKKCKMEIMEIAELLDYKLQIRKLKIPTGVRVTPAK